jgi:uncharacterized alpha/beta hydrolase family protein
MSFRTLFTKGFALAQSGASTRHSKRASSLAKQAMSSFRSARSKKGDQKLDAMLDGLNYLSSSILEVSDSVTPIAKMNAVSALLAENIKEIIHEAYNTKLKPIKK